MRTRPINDSEILVVALYNERKHPGKTHDNCFVVYVTKASDEEHVSIRLPDSLELTHHLAWVNNSMIQLLTEERE